VPFSIFWLAESVKNNEVRARRPACGFRVLFIKRKAEKAPYQKAASQ
jgi:hypothetical protein